MKTLTCTLAVATTAALLQAQSPLSGLAHGLVVQEAMTGARSLLCKPVGDSPYASFPGGVGDAPTYTVEALLHRLGVHASAAAAYFEMSAISTGNDFLPIVPDYDSAGQITSWHVEAGSGSGWAAIALSVSEFGVTAVNGTVFGARFAELRTAGSESAIGSDLFSYWFDSNVGIPASLIDTSHFELGHEHMGAGVQDQVTGLDTYMPAIVEARNEPTHLIPVMNQWFFTLTPGAVTSILANWDSNEQLRLAFDCPASEIGTNYVYWARWGTDWSHIEVAFTPESLGLTSGGAIDGLAFYNTAGHKGRVLFSLTQATSAGREQLLVGGYEAEGSQGVGSGTGQFGNWPLRINGSSQATVQQEIGVGNETDIDAICTYDPEVMPGNFCSWIALPVQSMLPTGIGCSAERYRVYDGNGADAGEELLLHATNLPSHALAVGWIVTIDSLPPLVIRRAWTGSRMQHVLPLPDGAQQISIVAACVPAFGPRLHSWELRIDP